MCYDCYKYLHILIWIFFFPLPTFLANVRLFLTLESGRTWKWMERWDACTWDACTWRFDETPGNIEIRRPCCWSVSYRWERGLGRRRGRDREDAVNGTCRGEPELWLTLSVQSIILTCCMSLERWGHEEEMVIPAPSRGTEGEQVKACVINSLATNSLLEVGIWGGSWWTCNDSQRSQRDKHFDLMLPTCPGHHLFHWCPPAQGTICPNGATLPFLRVFLADLSSSQFPPLHLDLVVVLKSVWIVRGKTDQICNTLCNAGRGN